MPSIDEVVNSKVVLERRGPQKYGLGTWDVYHINPSFIVVNAERRGIYYVVPNLHRDAPKKFQQMMAHHIDLGECKFKGIAKARRVADDARLVVLGHHSRVAKARLMGRGKKP